MTETLRPILELLVVIPGMLLAYLPMQSYLKQRLPKLFSWLGPLLLGMAAAGGLLSHALHIATGWALLAVIAFSMLIYMSTLRLSIWKSGSVFLAVVAVFACINSISRAINAHMTAEWSAADTVLWFCLGAGLYYNLLCWTFVAIAWYPATHAARYLIEDDSLPVTWKIFWILSTVFIGLNLFMVPKYRHTLYTGRVMQGYLVISLALLALLVLFYAMFLIIANNLNKNEKLQQENQFLAMQQSRYENLKSAIEETRQARHDLRHHFASLSTMAKDGDLEKIKSYLSAAQSRLPNSDIRFSDNRAVDSVIGHYYALAKKEGIPFSTKIDLPCSLPVDEMDLCLMLSNLLENALEASLRIEEEQRQIAVEAYLHSDRLMLIRVTNKFNGKLREKDGAFKSSKHKGIGIGIQSVRRTAEKSGGASTFDSIGDTFVAKVMLRGEE